MEMTTEEAIQAIMALVLPEKPEGWVSREEMAQAWGIGKDMASNRLKRLCEIGKLERMKCLVNGKSGYAYRVKSG